MSWTPPSRATMVGAWPVETLVQPGRARGEGTGLPLYLIAMTALEQLRRVLVPTR